MSPDDRLDALQGALARVCLAPNAAAEDLAALGGRSARWQLYRALVRNRMEEVLGDALPGTRRALGGEGLAACMSAFLDRAPPTTRYVRELSLAFVDFVVRCPEVVPVGAAPWTLDMARYEAAIMACHIALDPTDDPAVVDFDMALAPALCPAQRFLRVGWSVHRREVEAGAWGLLVYRAPVTDAVEVLELSPIAADLYERFARGEESVTESAKEALAARGAAADAVFVESFTELLGDLMDRGVLLGGRRAEGRTG